MKITNIKTIDELKLIGTEEEIKKEIEEIIKPFKLKNYTYNDLFEALKILQEQWCDFKKNHFKSKKDEYLFYLTNLEGKKLLDLLDVQDKHYEDIALTKNWFKNISKHVHPDKNNNSEESKKAFNALTKIYNILKDS